MSGPPVIVAYDPNWPVLAEHLLSELRAAVAGQDWVFDHIGSTSVPGLAAKNIVDLQIRAEVLPEYAFLDERFGPLGYRAATGARPDSPGVHRDANRGSERVLSEVLVKRLYWRDGTPPVILHIRRLDSPFGRYTVWFRDWLRALPAERDRYAAVKHELAAVHADDADYDDYTRAKTAYLDDVQAAFEKWGRRAQKR
ncbi:MAG TPA: GrpB family protein [Jatrophihabitans sp.]|jgi:dephospho-CoA kinase|nr:GrpB family protein [Jatrophihabitans sp.]